MEDGEGRSRHVGREEGGGWKEGIVDWCWEGRGLCCMEENKQRTWCVDDDGIC